MRPRVASILAITSLLALAPGRAARANGRFPSAEQLVVDPGDPSHIAVQVTYGFLSTRNDGATWVWSCEDAIGYGGVYDPPIALLDGGVLIAGIFDGLAVATPDTCDFTLVGGGLSERYVKDVSASKSDPKRAIAIVSNGLGEGLFDTELWETSDTGATWTQAGVDLPMSFLALTVDAAPSEENTIYASGFRAIDAATYVGAIARSSDRGATWELVDIPGTDNTSGPYLGAVDPTNPARLYVRTAAEVGKLLVSDDGGTTFEEVFTATTRLTGLALSPDGAELAIGSELDGLLVGSTSDLAFEPRSDVPARCLTWTNDAIYACAREALAGFTIGKSTDGGVTFAPYHRLACLDGPDPACSAGTDVAERCIEAWASQKEILQTDLCEDGKGGAGGGASSGSGGAGGAGGSDDGGCSCAVVAARDEAPGVVGLFAVGLFALARRARRGSAPRGR
jgi:hypothetical protein